MSDFDPHAPLGVCQHCQGPLSDCLLGCAYAEQLRAAADPTGPRLALGGDIWALRVEPGEAPVLPPLVEPPARPGLWEAKANPASRGLGPLDLEDPELQAKARAALAAEQARRDAERGRPRGNMGPSLCLATRSDLETEVRQLRDARDQLAAVGAQLRCPPAAAPEYVRQVVAERDDALAAARGWEDVATRTGEKVATERARADQAEAALVRVVEAVRQRARHIDTCLCDRCDEARGVLDAASPPSRKATP